MQEVTPEPETGEPSLPCGRKHGMAVMPCEVEIHRQTQMPRASNPTDLPVPPRAAMT